MLRANVKVGDVKIISLVLNLTINSHKYSYVLYIFAQIQPNHNFQSFHMYVHIHFLLSIIAYIMGNIHKSSLSSSYQMYSSPKLCKSDIRVAETNI